MVPRAHGHCDLDISCKWEKKENELYQTKKTFKNSLQNLQN